MDAVAFENVDHFPDAGDVLGGPGLEPADAAAKRATPEGSWFFQILAEPRSQFVQFISVRTRDGLPFNRQRCCLKDSLFNMTILVFAADNEADVFAFFERIVTLEDKAFVLRLDEGEASWNAGEDAPHAAPDDLFESFDERKFLLVELGVFGDGKDNVGRVPFLQLKGDVVNEEFVAGNGQAVLGIEVCEVRELAGEFVTQAWIGQDLPVTIAFAPLHECRDQ